MRRGRIFIYLALILVLGVVALFFVYQKFLQPTTPGTSAASSLPTPTPVVTTDVVMVTQHISRGQMLGPDMVGVVPYQKDLVIEGMFATIEDVIGKRAKLDLDPGFVLTQNMLTSSNMDISSGGSDAALMIPRGMVSVSIPIDRLSSISYAVQRGDHVNVIATVMLVDLDTQFQSRLPNLTTGVLSPGSSIYVGPADPNANTGSMQVDEKLRSMTNQSVPGAGAQGRAEADASFETPFYVVPSEAQRPRMVSQSLIQDVIVLQVGEFPLEQASVIQQQMRSQPSTEDVSMEPTPAVTPTPVPAAEPPDVISLIVTPQDAVTLNYLITSGAKLTLALRGTGDDTRVQTEAVTLQFLLDQYQIPVPIKLPYGLEPRVDDYTNYLPPEPTPTPTPSR